MQPGVYLGAALQGRTLWVADGEVVHGERDPKLGSNRRRECRQQYDGGEDSASSCECQRGSCPAVV